MVWKQPCVKNSSIYADLKRFSAKTLAQANNGPMAQCLNIICALYQVMANVWNGATSEWHPYLKDNFSWIFFSRCWVWLPLLCWCHPLWFLRDVYIRTHSASVASGRAINLVATHPSKLVQATKLKKQVLSLPCLLVKVSFHASNFFTFFANSWDIISLEGNFQAFKNVTRVLLR